jgi:hypothetical protein
METDPVLGPKFRHAHQLSCSYYRRDSRLVLAHCSDFDLVTRALTACQARTSHCKFKRLREMGNPENSLPISLNERGTTKQKTARRRSLIGLSSEAKRRGSVASAIGQKANARETEKQHCPSGGFGDGDDSKP